MKVKEVMTPRAKAIWITESLADAAKLMWENDCGMLPIIKDGRKVVGIITDRDICMATAIRDSNPSSISVEEVMTGRVFSVEPDDDVQKALKLMQKHRIRRVPVVNSEGELKGVLSMNDIVQNAWKPSGKRRPPIEYADVVTTYQAICERPQAIPITAPSAAM